MGLVHLSSRPTRRLTALVVSAALLAAGAVGLSTPASAGSPALITVTETASPSYLTTPGGPVAFNVTVTNDSGAGVVLTNLIDNVYGTLTGHGTCVLGGLIAPNGSYSCTFDRDIIGAAGRQETPTIRAVLTDADGAPVPDVIASATVSLLPASPVSVIKTAAPTSLPAPGASFTFTVVVGNNSPTQNQDISLDGLTDDVYGDLNGQGTCTTGHTISPGDTYTCAFSGTFTGVAGDSQTDTVTATATYDGPGAFTGSGQATVAITPAVVPTGYLEICKRADNGNGPVTGSFTFNVADKTVTLLVGTCSGPLKVPAGGVYVSEVPTPGTRISACSTWPTIRLFGCGPKYSAAIVRVVAGGVAKETVLTITNKATGAPLTGAVKVCKIAGSGIVVGTPFAFSVGGRAITVPAGPASQGGYCKIAYGFPRGSNVTVTEAASANITVSKIAVAPLSRKVWSNAANRQARVTVGREVTVATFTNDANQN